MANGLGQLSKAELRGQLQASYDTLELFQERFAELELALEDQGWRRQIFGEDADLNRSALDELVRQAEMYYLKNPLIKRAVNLQCFYVLGQGVEIMSKNERVNKVVQAFMDDPKNRAELTSHEAMWLTEVDLQLTANLFFTFFSDTRDGKTRVRTFPLSEIEDIVTNPEDRREPWFYKRVWSEAGLNGAKSTAKTAYYPDVLHTKESHATAKAHKADAHPTDAIDGKEIIWDNPVLHVKVGGTKRMKFGIPEVYAALDWAAAARKDSENYATIKSALASFAFTLTRQGGSAAIAAAKAKLETTIASGEGWAERNPPPQTGAIFLQQARGMLEPVKTAGAQPHPEEGRTLRLWVSAATGIPETMLMGNADVGNLATAKTLDRPTELQMTNRQKLWRDIFRGILSYVLKKAIDAGELTGIEEADDDSMPTDEETGQPLDATIEVNFPPIIEHDPETIIKAVAQVAPLALVPERELARVAMSAMGVTHIDDHLNELFDEETGERKEPLAPEGIMVQQPPWASTAGGRNGGAAGEPAPPSALQRRQVAGKQLREALRALRELELPLTGS